MDLVYEDDDDNPVPLFQKIRINLHIIFCPHCADELKRLEDCRELMRSGFIPASPSFEDRIMERLPSMNREEQDDDQTIAVTESPGGFSFRTWVIIGFFVLASLASPFFEMNFLKLVSYFGSSFLVPLGITVGIMLSIYGAFFIGSHLRELSDHFKINKINFSIDINRKTDHNKIIVDKN